MRRFSWAITCAVAILTLPGTVPRAGAQSTDLGGGITVPEQHLAVSTKDALRAVLTPPLAAPASGHGAALGLDADDLNALIAYIRSL